MNQDKNIESMRKIVEALPKENCGKCGYENCGKYARSLVEGRTSPFECRNDPLSGYLISKILGVFVPQQSIRTSYHNNTHDQLHARFLRHHIHHLSQSHHHIHHLHY